MIAASRQQFATPVKDVEEYLEGLFGGERVKKKRSFASEDKNKGKSKKVSSAKGENASKNESDRSKKPDGQEELAEG